MQAEMIELDLLLSKDGVPVVIHEDNLERTTGIVGLVSNYTLDELRNFDIGSWFGEEFIQEHFLPLKKFLLIQREK